MSKRRDNAEKKVIEYFYDEAKHHGAFLFGSIVKDSDTPSDVDVIILTHDLSTFHHRIENIDNVTYDIFEMSPEYGFYLLQQRKQMWLYSFAMAKLIAGSKDLLQLKTTAEDILKSERFEISSHELDRQLFSLNRLLDKIKKYQNHSSFRILHFDFLNRAHQILHAAFERWPDIGSRVDKIERTLSDFGDFSRLLQQSLKESETEKVIAHLEAFIQQINIDQSYSTPRAIHVSTVDVSQTVQNFLKKHSLGE